MHDIAQKQIFFFKLPELDPDPVVKFPDPAKRSGSATLELAIKKCLINRAEQYH
jgi:hypothetical protein